jgi:hypothetical protein
MQFPLNQQNKIMKNVMTKSGKISLNATTQKPPVSPMRLVLEVINPNTGETKLIATHLQERLIAGRSGSTPESNEGKPLPDLDMSAFNAVEHGVSRQHAAFVYLGDELSVEDLNSTNGTRINGFQIVSGRLYRLRNGDELEFGRLRMTVKVVRVSH